MPRDCLPHKYGCRRCLPFLSFARTQHGQFLVVPVQEEDVNIICSFAGPVRIYFHLVQERSIWHVTFNVKRINIPYDDRSRSYNLVLLAS